MIFEVLSGALVGFFGIELASIFIHKYLFHGWLWNIHRTHHKKRESVFEWNDLFSISFAGLSLILIVMGSPFEKSVGWGITAYGMLYFYVHDILTHRRFFSWPCPKWLELWRDAHRVHHQRADKEGQGPFGLFWPY